MHDLGTLGGTYSIGLGISGSGHIAALGHGRRRRLPRLSQQRDARPGNPRRNIELWTRHQRERPGSGIRELAGGEYFEIRPFLWTKTAGMQNLGTLGGSSSNGIGINDRGLVTGGSENADGEFHAFLYDGQMHDLGTLGGTYSYGQSINANGRMTGMSRTAAGEFRLSLRRRAVTNLSSLGGTWSNGFGINSSGQVVGLSRLAGDVHVPRVLVHGQPGHGRSEFVYRSAFRLGAHDAERQSTTLVKLWETVAATTEATTHSYATPISVPEPSTAALAVLAVAAIAAPSGTAPGVLRNADGTNTHVQRLNTAQNEIRK